MTDTKPCVMCRKHLEPVREEYGWRYMQPYAGGEIRLLFAYGSTQFDNRMTGTTYQGVICDTCAATLVPAMIELTDPARKGGE